MASLSDYAGGKPAWCPGCGNFGIQAALKKALVELDVPPWKVLMVSGIGQGAKLPHYIKCNLLNELHGRPVPAAIGARIANSELLVIAESGDGDGYGEGGNHWMHAMRRNHRIAYFVHNNQVYGLTKGQASPTSDAGFITKTTPQGASNPVNPLTLAIGAGATFVARGFAGDIDHLCDMMKLAITHRGFALLDILQPCVTFNHRNTFGWYRERVRKVDSDPGFDASDVAKAFAKAQEWGDRIPIGVIYRRQAATFEESLPALKKGPLVKQRVDSMRAASLLDEFV